MSTTWTREQGEAIQATGGNLLVAAAAGAGKTAVLVERIIRKISRTEQPEDIDRLLVVTFTNAAAAEMRERIADSLVEELESNPEDANLRRQLTLLGKASITTLHSFCLEVIRNNFQKLDLDPDFRVGEETETGLLKREALEEVFDKYYLQEKNEDFLLLIDCFVGNRDDFGLRELVLEVYDFGQSYPWPEKWLREKTEFFSLAEGEDFGKTIWGKILLESVRNEISEALSDYNAIREKLLPAGLKNYEHHFSEEYTELCAKYRELLQNKTGNWDVLRNSLAGFEFARLPRAEKDGDPEVREEAQKCRNDLKDVLKKLHAEIMIQDSGAIRMDFARLYRLLSALSELVLDFSREYAAKKRAKNIVDFNDLEHFCLQILNSTEEQSEGGYNPVRQYYQDKYTEILVDEYQDSNLVQELIIQLVSREERATPNVFMVGDVKQSIYRFRQAKPELFLKKYQSYPEIGKYRKILLYKNFRSRKEVIDGVNYLFSLLMSQEVGELDYTAKEALIFAEEIYPPEKQASSREIELHLLQKAEQKTEKPVEQEAEGEETEDGEEAEEKSSLQKEALLIARRIRELLGEEGESEALQVYERGKGYRPLEYKDIVILLRTTKNWAEVFREELTAEGIPVFADTGSGFFQTVEISIIISLLQIIDNPLQDIPLLSVLRSPLFGFSATELAEIRIEDKKAFIYDALVLYAKREGEGGRKARAFFERLQSWQQAALEIPVDRLLWRIYSESGYFALVGALPAGEQRQANLRVLFERARRFEETSYRGLFNFISFVQKLKINRGDLGSATILGEKENVVRIMSIHKSKGLEFPVVFLAGCGKRFNLQDLRKSVLLHEELGFGPDIILPEKSLVYPSPAKSALREKLRRESLSEEMRILYVALTRAREKLIITGRFASPETDGARWLRIALSGEGKPEPNRVLKSGNYLDWLVPSLLLHDKSGQPLREAFNYPRSKDDLLHADPSLWKIKFWQEEELFSREPLEDKEFFNKGDILADLASFAGGEYREEVRERLSWSYPRAALSGQTAKYTVSEIKNARILLAEEEGEERFFTQESLINKPLFLREKRGLSAAEKGTAMHIFLQKLCLKEPDLLKQREQMLKKELLSRKQAESLDLRKVGSFLESPLGQRLQKADKVWRELPFNLEIDCSELNISLTENCRGEKILVQGVIDCCFLEDGAWVLLDYKTDRVTEENEQALRERYSAQVEFYKRALNELSDYRVKESFLVFLDTSKTVSC